MTRKEKYTHRSEFLKQDPENCQAVHYIDLVLLKRVNSPISNEPICLLLPASDCQIQGHRNLVIHGVGGAVGHVLYAFCQPCHQLNQPIRSLSNSAMQRRAPPSRSAKTRWAGRQESGPLDRLLPICDNQPRIRLTMVCPALRPAPMARMTVAEPVTMSPPAKTPGMEVSPVSSLISI